MGIVKRAVKGQMTVELAVCIPVFIALSLVVFNAILFMEQCAAFDRHALDAVRVFASSPAHGQTQQESANLIQSSLKERFTYDFVDVSVQTSSSTGGFVTYIATLQFRPTLFGRHFSGAVYDVFLDPLKHSIALTIDPYKPGVVI